jgi:hypothetical protein
MKTQLIESARKWSLYSAVLAAMVYTAMTLSSQPAYAGTCTPARCKTLQEVCAGECSGYGGVREFICPGRNGTAICECNNGYLLYPEC